MMKKGYFLLSLLVSNMAFATSMNDAFNQGRDVGKGNNSNAQQIMKDFQPNQIQGYQARPQESQYYTGVKGGNPNLTGTGMSKLENSESGKAIKDSIINNPKVDISQDSDFIKSSNNIRDNAEVISGIKGGQCVNKVLSKTSFSYHFCEKEQSVNKICKNTAMVKWTGKKELKEKVEKFKLEDGGNINNSHILADNKAFLKFYLPYKKVIVKDYKVIIEWVNPPPKGYQGTVYNDIYNTSTFNVFGGSAKYISGYIEGQEWRRKFKHYPKVMEYKPSYFEQYKVDNEGYINVHISSPNIQGFNHFWVANIYRLLIINESLNGLFPKNNKRAEIEVTFLVEDNTLKPEIEWVNSCGNFDDSNLIKTNEKCTSPGGNRNFFKDGKTFSLYSDCWEKQAEYLVSEESDNECKKYEDNPNCTVGERECILNDNGSCIRHRVKYQCQTTTKTDGYICGDKFFCSDGSCSDLEGSVNSDFGHAVSQLATVAQAGKDVGLDPDHLKAFSGKAMFCRKSGFGFSDCCKDSGWGHKAGLAKCNSEENALGKAKEKKLVVYVGTFCSKKILKKCVQRKSGYCVFDNKLARIIQYQGRSGQLGIGFGGAKNPDCRGITVDELQRIDFNAMDYSDFYDELNERTNLPDKQQLMEHMRNSIINQLQEK